MAFIPGVVAAFWLSTRWQVKFNWRENMITILLVSVLATPFAWSIDMVVLLPAVFFILNRFVQSPVHQWPNLPLLVLAQLVIFLQGWFSVNEFFNLWLPLVIGVAYWNSCHVSRREVLTEG